MTDGRRFHPDEAIRMGRVSRPHGVSGEIEVRLDWPESRGLLEVKQVILEGVSGERVPYDVVSARQTPKGLLLRLAGVDDRNAAEALQGQVVGALREQLPRLGESEYYLCDLVGLEVVTPEGPLGKVVQVEIYPSVDALVIEAPGGARFEQPILDEWIERVRFEERRIELSTTAGLIEVPVKRASSKNVSEG